MHHGLSYIYRNLFYSTQKKAKKSSKSLKPGAGDSKGGRRGSRMKEDTATPTNQFLKQERATQTMNRYSKANNTTTALRLRTF